MCLITCGDVAKKIRDNKKIPGKLRRELADFIKEMQEKTRNDAFPNCEVIIKPKTNGLDVEIKF